MLLYSIYSGQFFFVVTTAFVMIVMLDLSRRLDGLERARRVAGFCALLAIPLSIFAAPPLPVPIALVTLTVTSVYVVRGFGHPSRRIVLGGAAVAACLVAMSLELPHHLARGKVPRPSRLFVIGDSLSSGGFGEQAPWPELFGRHANLPVTNLALASGDVATALERQVTQLPRPQEATCVLVVIGGNDMLDGTDSQQFEDDLDRIVSVSSGNGQRTVALLELPLLPGRWSYGAAQRRVARKHDCTLVPKRIVARALLTRGNTSDGLHFTQQGHENLARSLHDWLGW